MTGGEVLNLLHEEMENDGWIDAEIIQADVVELLNRIEIPVKRRHQITLTNEEIEAAKTPAGGFTRNQLEKWGVPWPPPKGWRRELTRTPQNSKLKSLN